MPKRTIFRLIFKKKDSKLALAVKAAFLLSFFASASFFGAFLYFTRDFPRPEIFTERNLSQSTKIYDRSGQTLLYEVYGEEKRTWVPLTEIPKSLQQAVISAEDGNFYRHFGVDPRGVARAILADLRIGSPVYGGSTIPQQLIRSTFLTAEKTAERKMREIIMAIELDRRYPKDRILEWYLNQVPFGQNAYGAEAASQTYFGKKISEISLPEAAILASLIQAPYYLAPKGEHQDELFARKDYVLRRMQALGFLSREEMESAQKEGLNFIEKPIQLKAPYFTLWVKQILEEKYGDELLRSGGLKVYTSLDWDIQQTAEKSVAEGVERNKAYGAYNAGMAAISPKTGEVLALTVGTGDYNAKSYPEKCVSGISCLFDPKFNVVVGTRENPGRQPGSAFKPFVYATAFKKDYDDKYVVTDEFTDFGRWGDQEHYTPQNFDGLFRGPVTLRQSLAQSLNVPAVKTLLNLAGLEDSVKTAQDLGITTLKPPYGPSIVLGGWEVRLIEMISAYGVFAAEGLKMPITPILKIEGSNGEVIFQSENTPKRVLDSHAARLVNNILSDNEARTPMFGPRSTLYFPEWQVAAKTGTTQDFRDGWIIGYTPSIVTGVWVGNNNNAPIKKEPGSVVAGPIFHDFLEKTLPRLSSAAFTAP
ncbi:MAG: transglycosylase domain-containing protein [Candidatus Nealsonbacteria bacterium]|nr:transglycosylase domain-containing protein [Candidatus Nealsonbacteria bacterium]